MNITDVGHMVDDADSGEDKMLLAAKKQNKDPWQIAAFYTEAFFKDIHKLNIQPATHYPKATEHVGEMIESVKTLIDKGYAYIAKDNCIYFEIDKFPNYGKLSGKNLEDLVAGSRIEINENKKNPLDFAVWILKDGHIMKWDSPWGVGYPGWHIECSAMSRKYLGDTIDIHTGGEDNIFPHHDCEIAQSEAVTGKKFANFWLHARHLRVENQKMSKSLGNFYTVDDLINKGYSAEAIRYVLMSSNYRQRFNFTFQALDNAMERLNYFNSTISELLEINDANSLTSTKIDDVLIKTLNDDFTKAMDNDLNVSGAFGALSNFARAINLHLQRNEINKASALTLIAEFERINKVLGFLKFSKKVQEELPANLMELINKRLDAKKNKDFALADKFRDELLANGIEIKDTAGGSTWKKKQ